MPAPIDTTLTRIRISTTVGGTFTNVGKTRDFSLVEGSEGETTLRWFGGEAIRPGDPTLSGSVSVWWDLDDTSGQTVLRAAKKNGTTVYLQFCPEGTTTGSRCEQLEATISEVSRSSSAGGDAVEGSFSFIGVPSTLDTITLA